MASPRMDNTGPLSQDQVQQMVDADRTLARIVGGPMRWSKFNGVTLALMAFITGFVALLNLLSMQWDGLDLLIGAALGAFAWVEFSGQAMLKKLDPAGAARLRLNQLALLAAIVVYCLWKIYAPSDLASDVAAVDPQMAGMVKDIEQLTYSCVLIVSAIFQGGLAWYYGRSARALELYRTQTPGWILDVQSKR